MSEFGFVILHYGDVEVTKVCIDSIFSLRQGKNDNVHIVLVDNDSDYWQNKWDVYNENANVTVTNTPTDCGFSKANNIGFQKLCSEFKCDYVVVANNDIVFSQELFLQKIKQSYLEQKWQIVGPDVYVKRKDVHQNPLSCKAPSLMQLNKTIILNYIAYHLFLILYPLVWFYYQKLVSKRKKESQKNNIGLTLNDVKKDEINIQKQVVLCGACLIFDSEYIESEKQIFYPETNFYYEEYILFERCKKNGYKLVYDPRIQVQHLDGESTTQTYQTFRNKLLFIIKNTLESAKIYKRMLVN